MRSQNISTLDSAPGKVISARIKPQCFPNLAIVRSLLLPIICLSVAVTIVCAQDIPLPRPRPVEFARAGLAPSLPDSKPTSTTTSAPLTPPQEAYAALPQPTQSFALAPTEPSACQVRLTSDLAVIHPLPPIVGPGDCGALDVVRLDAIVLADHSKVAVLPPATMRCTMAEAVVHWVREEVAPAAGELGSPLRGLENYDSFECRGRNRVVGAKVSEHGLANALDIKSLKLADGAVLGPTDVNVPKDFRAGMRHSACARFMTVLGPGSDGYHESHIHVDLAERRNGYRLCQWDVREPPAVSEIAADEVPLPRPRPTLDDPPRFTTAGSSKSFDGHGLSRTQ
jgi:hypothetical protein